MHNLESLTDSLTRQGFWPHLRRTASGWHCDLFNGVFHPSRLPSAEAATALEALVAADGVRREIAEGRA